MKSFTDKTALDIIRSNIEYERTHPDMWKEYGRQSSSSDAAVTIAPGDQHQRQK